MNARLVCQWMTRGRLSHFVIGDANVARPLCGSGKFGRRWRVSLKKRRCKLCLASVGVEGSRMVLDPDFAYGHR